MQTNFLLGAIEITEPARLLLKRVPLDLIARHAVNEHGTLTRAERARNELSMKTIGPIKSRYRVDPTKTFTPHIVIETDKGWSTTIIRVE